jgi:DNA-binding NtrC family response regulator
LATVYGIVRQHDGHISVYSEPGHGSSFKCYLPLADEAAAELVAPREEPVDLEGTETIMLVEDEAAVRTFAASVLKRQGYSVMQAEDAESCLALLRDHEGPLDLLVTDVVLPGMDGINLFGNVREFFPESKVLYMSGYSEEIITRRGMMEEGAPFLPKPFSAQGFSARIRDVLKAD